MAIVHRSPETLLQQLTHPISHRSLQPKKSHCQPVPTICKSKTKDRSMKSNSTAMGKMQFHFETPPPICLLKFMNLNVMYILLATEQHCKSASYPNILIFFDLKRSRTHWSEELVAHMCKLGSAQKAATISDANCSVNKALFTRYNANLQLTGATGRKYAHASQSCLQMKILQSQVCE